MVQRRGLQSAGLASLILITSSPRIASAHGGVTGAQDFMQDYALLLFLLAVILIGAGVLVWVLIAPMPLDADGTDVASESRFAQKSVAPQSSKLHEARSVDHEDRRTS